VAVAVIFVERRTDPRTAVLGLVAVAAEEEYLL
jgi:hypothetical protein